MDDYISAKDISIIIPVYRNPARMDSTLDYITSSPLFERAEIIVAIDEDIGTLDAATKYERVLIDYSQTRRGKGGAIIDGIKKSTRPLVGFIDVDLPISLKTFKEMYGMLGPYEAVIASRRVPTSVVMSKPSLLRRIASRVFNLMVRRMFQIEIYDTQCGAKVFKRDVLMSVLDNVKETGRLWDLELLVLLRQRSHNVFEFPADWTQVERSKMTIWDMKDIFSALLRIKRRLKASQ